MFTSNAKPILIASTNTPAAMSHLGESGCDKTALLANWAAEYRQAHPDESYSHLGTQIMARLV
ncbi:hypothetical protein THIOM_002502 [Candidatus Thiomargarita nelsonii]|uniref:Uncharacterized protein n=1 Tax=Candidatus Thiomargarita nelsonii TaxID=1003181 RepID=A0A176S183_9GAMM|nr:hypothetical protein THIOM_002502 [Candidatus Thiomargarita nelsonii]